MRDFTVKTYQRLIETLIGQGYPIFGVKNFLLNQPKKGVLIRHDVDRKPANSLEIAKIESVLKVSTTYYFRYYGSSNNPQILTKIRDLGHEIGYHYETNSRAQGNLDNAIKLFELELSYFRRLAPIETVTMHGSPLSRFNNYDIWLKIAPQQYCLLGDAFKSIDYSNMYYFTDTGRTWNAKLSNLRDRPQRCLAMPSTINHKTKTLIEFIIKAKPPLIAITTHPERWSSGLFDWTVQLVKDRGINLIKNAIRLIRKI